MILFFAFLLTGCGEEEIPKEDEPVINWDQDDSVDLVKGWNKEEQFRIDQFVKAEGWDMIETGTGLRYMIYESDSSTTEKAKPGQIAWVQFEIAPMGDTVVYRSEEGVAESFLVEMDHVEFGLHEAITHLTVGDRAKIILPNHLAHGLLGDNIKIPPLSVVVYDLKLVGLE